MLNRFPALTLEQIFGALTYYLANRNVIDEYLAEAKDEFEILRIESRRNHPALYARLAETKQKPHTFRA